MTVSKDGGEVVKHRKPTRHVSVVGSNQGGIMGNALRRVTGKQSGDERKKNTNLAHVRRRLQFRQFFVPLHDVRQGFVAAVVTTKVVNVLSGRVCWAIYGQTVIRMAGSDQAANQAAFVMCVCVPVTSTRH